MNEMTEDLIIYTPMYVTFFWAVVLLISKRENNRAKFFLGVFMFVAFLLYLSHAIFFQRNVSAYLIFDPVYNFASLSVYPLYYWYIKLLTVETNYQWKNLHLLTPAFFISIFSFVLYQFMSENERMDYILGFLLKSKTDITYTNLMLIQKYNYIIGRVIFAIQVSLILYFGQKLVRNYNKQISNFYSNLESKSILWVNFILFSLVITSVVSIVFNVIGRSFFMGSKTLLIIPSIIFSVLLFIIGLQGYMQNHSVFDFEQDEQKDKDIVPKSYNSNRLDEKLTELFVKDAIYKNPDLKITHLSEKLHTNRTYISKHINTQYSCTFNDFVNRYRIEEAKRLLSDESSQNFSLNYVSEKSGFGSMGTFMRVFREFEGITPGQFREKNLV
jgi:AraC-like DNA-binding protein